MTRGQLFFEYQIWKVTWKNSSKDLLLSRKTIVYSTKLKFSKQHWQNFSCCFFFFHRNLKRMYKCITASLINVLMYFGYTSIGYFSLVLEKQEVHVELFNFPKVCVKNKEVVFSFEHLLWIQCARNFPRSPLNSAIINKPESHKPTGKQISLFKFSLLYGYQHWGQRSYMQKKTKLLY